MRIAFVASSVPRRCGIATFTADLSAAVKSADPAARIFAAAINEPGAARAYGPDVRWRIQQEEPASYREAAVAISASNVDIVNVQHEFGLYGVWHDGTYDDHLRVFLESCTKPVVTTLHTVAPQPEPWALETVRYISEHSEQVVVMGTTAARLLREVYGVTRPPVVIEHGMPAIDPKGRHRLKRQLGVEDRPIVSTFGLVDPRKGLEYVIEAMPEIVARNPDALYLVVGQTHPELQKRQGEAYRNSLIEAAARLGLRHHVKFVNQYLTQREVVDYLLATDVYVTPYLDPNQITSGTLAYALGAGKAIVSTPYLHAQEVLDRGRGILVPFRDAPAVATAVNSVLGDAQRKRELEIRAYEYGKQMAWPAIGQRVLAMMRDVLDHRAATLPATPPAPSSSVRAVASTTPARASHSAPPPAAPRERDQAEQLHEEPTPIA